MTAIVEDDDDNRYKRDFDELFRQKRHTLYRIAHRIVGNDEDAEDALQTAFMKLMERPWPIEVIKNPVGYLVQATRNAAVDAVRMRTRQLSVHVPFDEAQIFAVASHLNMDDRVELLRLALAEIKPKLVDTLILCWMEGLTCKEVAAIRGVTIGTVLKDLYRARFRVKRLIRIQEKRHEAQKAKRPGIPKPDMADPSAT
jgi:RNA polymerase sigma-70 factor, ECF subfamily